MRIAICLFGKTGTVGRGQFYSDLSLKKLARNFNKYIATDEHHFDIFIHSWSLDKRDEIIQRYKPTDFIIEGERFNKEEAPRIDVLKKDWDKSKGDHDARKKIIKDTHINFWTMDLFNSRWYSQSRSIKLMDAYSSKNGISYDHVMVTRFDCAWSTEFDFGRIDPCMFYSLEPTPIEAKMGMNDYWFVSSQKNISELGKAWDYIDTTEWFWVGQDPLTKERFNSTTSLDMIRHIIDDRIVAPRKTIYEQYKDCFLARGRDVFWTDTDLGKI